MVEHAVPQVIAFSSAITDLADTHDAARSVLETLSGNLPDGCDLIIAFATIHHAPQFGLLHETLVTGLGASMIVIITGQGVIGRQREIEHGPGLSVLAGRLPKGVRIKAITPDQMDWSLASEPVLRNNLSNDDQAPAAMLLFADPFTVPTNRILADLGRAFPQLPIVGGMASAGKTPGENQLMVNGKIFSQGAVGITLAGDLRVDTTVSQGCRPIGKPFVITKCQRNIIQELAGKNSLDTLNQLLESISIDDRELIKSRGLLVGRVINEYKDRFGRGDFLIRNIVGIDPKNRYMAISDPQTRIGQTIQFHVRDQKTAIDDFQMLLETQNLHGPGQGALLFSCNGRGTRLFSTPDTDARIIHEALGDIPLAGFFAAGEIGPVSGQNFIHGHTASLAVFRQV